jgi:large conductance mechanosensitive channel
MAAPSGSAAPFAAPNDIDERRAPLSTTTARIHACRSGGSGYDRSSAPEGGAVLREFRDFVAKGNLIELAVAFILGVAFAAVVGAFSNVILSLIGATFGADLTFDHLNFQIGTTPIPYGAFLTALVDFLIIAFALFLIVKAYNRFREKPDPSTRACPECTIQIPNAAKRCPNCTSLVTPVA